MRYHKLLKVSLQPFQHCRNDANKGFGLHFKDESRSWAENWRKLMCFRRKIEKVIFVSQFFKIQYPMSTTLPLPFLCQRQTPLGHA